MNELFAVYFQVVSLRCSSSLTAGFSVGILKMFVNNVADCNDLWKHMAEISVVKNGFVRRLSKDQKGLERSGPVVFQRDVTNLLQWQVQLARSAEEFMFCAYCSDVKSSSKVMEQGFCSSDKFTLLCDRLL